MLVDDLGYFATRAGHERGVAQQAGNRYVQTCHRKLAERYERMVQSFHAVPKDWPLDRLG